MSNSFHSICNVGITPIDTLLHESLHIQAEYKSSNPSDQPTKWSVELIFDYTHSKHIVSLGEYNGMNDLDMDIESIDIHDIPPYILHNVAVLTIKCYNTDNILLSDHHTVVQIYIEPKTKQLRRCIKTNVSSTSNVPTAPT